MECIVADPQFVAAFRALAPALTKNKLREVFGISETTWCKLRDGRPVKRQTLERITRRLEDMRSVEVPFEASPTRKAA